MTTLHGQPVWEGDGVPIPPDNTATVQHPAPWSRCAALAEAPRILEELRAELHAVGLVGEDRAAQLVFLAAVSRLLRKPVSVVVKGPSSAGKSYVVQRVLDFFPGAAYHSLSGGSERALIYSEESFRHRMLVFYEAAGMGGEFATYLLRSLISEGRIRYELAEKTSKGVKGRLIEKEGPTGVILTTTAVRLHPENETRLLSIPVNDSRAQTRSVLLALAEETDPGSADLDRWHALQQWLEGGERDVSVPFAPVLADLVPPVAVRLRRDFATVLGLIRAHALLHRGSRGFDAEGRIVARIEDYEIVRELIAGILSASVGATVSPETRETVNAVSRLRTEHEEGVPQSALVEDLKLDKGAVSRRVRAALQSGYLANQEDRKGRPARLVTGEPLPEDVEILPTADEVRDGCTVARLPEGYDPDAELARLEEKFGDGG